jgi:hypothetical protein
MHWGCYRVIEIIDGHRAIECGSVEQSRMFCELDHRLPSERLQKMTVIDFRKPVRDVPATALEIERDRDGRSGANLCGQRRTVLAEVLEQNVSAE